MQSSILQKSLIQIGLSIDEINVYMSMLDMPKISVSSICQLTGYNRMKAYKILDHLKELGFVYMNKDYISGITVTSPTRVVAMLRDQEEQSKRLANTLSSNLPALLAHFYNNKSSSYVRVFQGKYQLGLLFDEVLEQTSEGGEFLSLGEGEDFNDMVDRDYLLMWIRRRVKKNINIRVLIKNDNEFFKSQIQKDAQDLRQTKVLPKGFMDENGLMNIFGEKLVIWDTLLLEAVVIDNRNMANLFRSMFDGIWNSL
jgi:sugar-specific transcriptional regulator TrmB